MIDSRAIIDPRARIAEGVTIGPWTHIDGDVQIGAGTWIGSHSVVRGRTRIGSHNKIFQFTSIGEDCQDQKYQGEDTLLEIGDHNHFREFCTIHRGTVQGGGATRIGNHNLFMAYTHVAHDCRIGNHVIFSNNASVAGHVQLDDYVVLAGFSGAHQFCRIGEHSFLGKGTLVGQDVPPYMLIADNNEPSPHGLNVTGLKRRGFSAEDIQLLRRAYKILYRQGLSLQEAIGELEALQHSCEALRPLVQFLMGTERGIVR